MCSKREIIVTCILYLILSFFSFCFENIKTFKYCLLYVVVMSDDNELIRQTIRIHPSTKKRLHLLLKSGKYVTESELIRHALNLGIDILEKKNNE